MIPQRTCSIPDCNKPLQARGWCAGHYRNWSISGNPLPNRPGGGRAPRPAVDRAWAKVRIRDGCWDWLGMRSGYGLIKRDYPARGLTMAHRVIYESVYGPIPNGLVLDHLCTNRLCVRPDHLEPVTNAENILRGVGPPAHNARKTHCKRGHGLPPARMKNGVLVRVCRICSNANARARRARSPRSVVTHCPYGHPYSGDNLVIHKSGERRCRACTLRWGQERRDRKRSVTIRITREEHQG